MMLSLSAEIRKKGSRELSSLKKKGKLPAVVYGPGAKNVFIEVDERDFKKVFEEAGESSLIELIVEKEGGEKRLVLIHDIQRDPLTDEIIHADFYQAPLKEEIEVTVPLVFEGESKAVKELGGTLVKDIHEVEVRALAKNLPHEIKVDVSNLQAFEDKIFVRDLKLPAGVKIKRDPQEIVVWVAEPEKVEEELAQVIEEKVEEVEQVEEKKKEEEEEGQEEK